MSLLVSLYTFAENGETVFVEREHGLELAGFENCRTLLYGSDLSIKLNFTQLLQLKNSDLWVSGEELVILDNELNVLLQNVDSFSKISGYKVEYIKARVSNIKNSIKEAIEINGGIVIW